MRRGASIAVMRANFVIDQYFDSCRPVIATLLTWTTARSDLHLPSMGALKQWCDLDARANRLHPDLTPRILRSEQHKLNRRLGPVRYVNLAVCRRRACQARPKDRRHAADHLSSLVLSSGYLNFAR